MKTTKQSKATSLDHAIELAKRHAKERRLPSKVMADLMGVELKTYYRWLLENTMPLNRIAQFEALTGSRYISEYLSVLHPQLRRLYRPRLLGFMVAIQRQHRRRLGRAMPQNHVQLHQPQRLSRGTRLPARRGDSQPILP